METSRETQNKTLSKTGTETQPAPFVQCAIPSQLEVATSCVASIVSQFRSGFRFSAGNPLEFEARLGRGGQRWKNGVDANFFKSSLKMLEVFPDWCSVDHHDWTDSHDYFYEISDGRRIRTSMYTNPVKVVHIEKTQFQRQDLRIKNHPYDVRVSLKSEEDVSASDLPEATSPYLVRIKKRKSFVLQNWRFDMTQVWEGKSRGSAEREQSQGNAIYEMEVEFCGGHEYIQTHSDDYIATSLLLKVCNILGDCVLEIVPM